MAHSDPFVGESPRFARCGSNSDTPIHIVVLHIRLCTSTRTPTRRGQREASLCALRSAYIFEACDEPCRCQEVCCAVSAAILEGLQVRTDFSARVTSTHRVCYKPACTRHDFRKTDRAQFAAICSTLWPKEAACNFLLISDGLFALSFAKPKSMHTVPGIHHSPCFVYARCTSSTSSGSE